jgi:hypothetical protein
VQEQIQHAGNAQSRQALGHFRADAGEGGYGEIVNIASISTAAPLGNATTPTAARAG